MLKALLDTIRSEFKYLLFFFVLGFIVLPVMSWQSEYDKDCKEAQTGIRQYLVDSYQIDRGLKEMLYIDLCRASRTVDGRITVAPLLTEEGREEAKELLEKWKGSDVLKNCEEITEILFCQEREPTWVKVIKFIQMLFFGLWFFLVLTIAAGGGWRELSFSFWASFLCGLSMGWYVTRWLYG